MADFQKRLALFEKRNVKIIAGSTDDIENTTKTLEKYEISFPMAYGMNAEAFAKLTGVFYHPEKHYMHGAGFILRPDGTVGDAVYSTGPIGRYTAGECIGMIDYWLKQASQPQKTTETTG